MTSHSRPFTAPSTIMATFSKHTFDIHYPGSFYAIASPGYIFIALSLATVFIWLALYAFEAPCFKVCAWIWEAACRSATYLICTVVGCLVGTVLFILFTLINGAFHPQT